MVSVKVTKHGTAPGVFAGRISINPLTEETRILAGRAIVDPLAEETHSRRSLPVSRVRRPRLLSRLRDGTVVDYFRRPLSLGGSTGALLQRAHAFAWRFGEERCCWCANVVRGGSLLVVFAKSCRSYFLQRRLAKTHLFGLDNGQFCLRFGSDCHPLFFKGFRPVRGAPFLF